MPRRPQCLSQRAGPGFWGHTAILFLSDGRRTDPGCRIPKPHGPTDASCACPVLAVPI